MARAFILRPITSRELTRIELRKEVQRQWGNLTIEIYQITVDRESPGEELYIRDQRTAVIAWKGNIYRYVQVWSPHEAFEQVLNR